jgi:hypothetical protein
MSAGAPIRSDYLAHRGIAAIAGKFFVAYLLHRLEP